MTRTNKQPVRRTIAGVLLSLCLLLAFGCGFDRGPTIQVTGRVTLDGQPLSEGRIWFTCPKSGSGFASDLGSDGTYSMSILEARVGETYEVCLGGIEDENAVDESGNPAGVIPPPVPARYLHGTTSGLAATITSASPQTFDFELKSE